MLVKELKTGALDGRTWYYKDSPVMEAPPEKANAYDDALPPKERKHTNDLHIQYLPHGK